MTVNAFTTLAVWSYGLAAAGYLAFALRVAVSWRAGARAAWLLIATIATALWAGLGIAVGLTLGPRVELAFGIADTLRYAAWFVFLGFLLRPARLPREVVGVAAVGLLASLLLAAGSPLALVLASDGLRVEFGIRLGIAIMGLILVEQLIRRVDPQMRWGIKPLCVALVGVFGCDLFLYADALLLGRQTYEGFAAAWPKMNTDPFGEGWLVRVKLTAPAEVDTLMDAAAYTTYCAAL